MIDHAEPDLFEDDDPNLENVDDTLSNASDLSSSVLYNTDWTVETIVSQLKKGRIDINPVFQRRDAWTVKAKSLLIESVLLNFPVPAITLAERSKERTFIVVDGKQRLSSFAQFFGEMPSSKFNSFKLSGLTQLHELNGLDYSQLGQAYPGFAAQLDNYSVRTNVIRGWKNDEILFSIFHRLNSGSVKLSPQELRQSLHPGPFTEFITNYSDKSPALRDIFPGGEPDFRMRDIELITRYMALAYFIEDYRGDLKKHLDKTVERLNSDWGKNLKFLETALARFEDSYNACTAVFTRKNAFKKWNGNEWETRTNRAVFDAIMINLLSDDALESFINRGQDVIETFKDISVQDDFKESVERTTKTTEALFTRVHKLQSGLQDIGIKTVNISFDKGENKITMVI
jgi:hypothetical protein